MARQFSLSNPKDNIAIQEVRKLVDAKTNETDFQVLKAQLLNMIAAGELTEGDISKEVLDGRVGYDGVTHDSLGDAIRSVGDDLEAMNQKVSETLDSSLVDGILISEGFIYLTSKGEIVSDGVEIPTQIGTGGGAGAAIIKLRNALSSSTISVTKGSSVILQYFFTSIEDEISTGNGTAQYYVNSVLKASETIAQTPSLEPHSFDIGDYLSEGTNQVRVRVTDSYGNYKNLTYTVIVLDISLTSNFDDTVVYTSTNVTFKYISYGSIDKTIYFIVDGTPYTNVQISSSGKQSTQIISGLEHGSHTLEVYATAQLYGETITSNVLKYDIAYAQEGNSEPIVSAVCNTENTVQGNPIIVRYLVYDPTSLTSTATQTIYSRTLNDDGVYEETVFSTMSVEVGRIQNTWSAKDYPVGEVIFEVKYGTHFKRFIVSVEELSVEVNASTTDLELCLQASGRSNLETEEERETWEFVDEHGNKTSTTFEKVNWNTTGWVNDDYGDTALSLSGDSEVTIGFRPFSVDSRAYGRTIEIDFMVHNMNDRDTEILSCMSGGIGISVTGDTASLSSEQTYVSCKYRDNKRIRVSFVIESISEDRVLSVYLNGILSSAKQYPANDSFQQVVPVDIKLGSTTSGINLYNIRCYGTALTSQELRDNYIADITDPGQKVTLFNDNNIYDVDTQNILYEEVVRRIPTMTIIGPLPQSKGDKKTATIDFVHPSIPDLSFTGKTCTIDVQGTSSQYYVRKNYKLKFKEAFQHALDQLPASVYTVKADYAEATSVNNTQNANIVHTLYEEPTPAQEANNLCRTTIYGYPITIFHQEDENSDREFIGKYNFNYDKGAENVFGFTSDYPNVECWEVCNNTSEKCLMHDDDLSDVIDANGEVIYTAEDDYEGRYPDGNGDYTNFQVMLSWVVSTYQDAVPHEYNGSYDTFMADTSVDTNLMYLIMDSADTEHYTHWMKCHVETTEGPTGSVVTRTWQDMGLYSKMVTPETYDGVTYEYDTDKKRLAKFKAEFNDHFDMHYCLVYYVYSFLQLMVDQRTKNLMWTCWDTVHWQPWFYDNDTCMGINNEGLLVLDYWYEDTDFFDGATVYNGQDHTFWVNFRMTFPNEIKETYQNMRSDGRISYSKMINYFNSNGSDKWSISLYNEDSEYKYLSLLRNDNNATYLYMIMGSGVEWREYFLSNRINYCDSKWDASDYKDDYASLRVYTPGTWGGVRPNADITLTPFSSMYVGVMYKANGTLQQERADAGTPVTIHAPNETFNDTETQIYGASQISSLGDLSGLYCGTVNVSNCSKLTELIIGSAADGYNNGNLKTLSVGNNPLLRKIDVRNCTNYGKGDNNTDTSLSLYDSRSGTGCINIEEIYATGTAIKGVELPPSGYLKVMHLPGTITNLTVRNQRYIEDFRMDGYSELTTLWVEKSVNVPVDEILANAINLRRVRLTDVNWTAPNSSNLKRLATMQGIDESGANTDTAVITGSCHVAKINGEDLNMLQEKFPYLTITYDTRVYSVVFKNYDGTILDTQEVAAGQNAVNPINRAENPIAVPVKESDEQYWYAFYGWSGSYTNVLSNVEVTATFTSTIQVYTVKFTVNGEVTHTATNVPYGTTAVYPLGEPTKEADYGRYMWVGWADADGNLYANETIHGDVDCDAQFDLVCVPGWENGGNISVITNFQECSWGQIIAVCEAHEAGILTNNAGMTCSISDWFNIGDTKPFTLTTGENLVAQIMDFDRDILTQPLGYVGDTKYAALSMCFRDLMAETRQMNAGTYPLFDYKITMDGEDYIADNRTFSVTSTINGRITLEVTGHSYFASIVKRNASGGIQTAWYFDERTTNTSAAEVYNFNTTYENESGVMSFNGLNIDATSARLQRYSDAANAWNNMTEATTGIKISIPVSEGEVVTVDAFNNGRNTGGWAKSEMRTWVSETLYNLMPRGLKQGIRPVQKKSSIGLRSYEISEVSDYMWLLANCELVNRTDAPYKDESSSKKNNSTAYAIFTDNQSRKKWLANGELAGDRTGEANYWWERSPNIVYVYHFYYVYLDGYSDSHHWANARNGICAGFCF